MTDTIILAEVDPRGLQRVPLTLHWTDAAGSRAVPVRTIQPLPSRHDTVPLPAVYEPSFYHGNGNASSPFNFSGAMRRLCADVVSRCELFHHIDVDRILFGVSQARRARKSGLQAKIIPMRFPGGEIRRHRRGRVYQVQRYWVDGIELLYVMNFCLPRFQDHSFDEKLVTIFHELYHIAPSFDGDLRRHNGRYCIHTHSQKGYDHHMAELVRDYLTNGADPALHAFLRVSFNQLVRQHGAILGQVVPVPKLVPIHDE